MAKVVKSNREVLDVDQELGKIEAKDKKKKEKNSNVRKMESQKDVKNKPKKNKIKKPKRGIFKFFYEVKVEVSKVKWPGKNEMVKYSMATLVFILFFSVFFYLIDLAFALLKAGV